MSLTKWTYIRVISSFYENIENILDSRISPIKLNFLFSLLAIKHYCLIFLFLNGYVLFLNILTIVRWNCDVLPFSVFSFRCRENGAFTSPKHRTRSVCCADRISLHDRCFMGTILRDAGCLKWLRLSIGDVQTTRLASYPSRKYV